MTRRVQRPLTEGGGSDADLIWVVRSGESGLLRRILERLRPGLSEAFSEGRVFVDGIRVCGCDQDVREGARIEVRRRRSAGVRCSVLERRGDLIAASKPAGVPTEPDRRGSSDSLVSQVAGLLGCARGALHAASRLDLDVSGVVLLAASPKACVHLERLRDAGTFRKFYVAMAASTPESQQGTWDTPLPGKGGGASLQSARTRYRVRATAGLVASGRPATPGPAPTAVLLELEAVTGRFHQLRRHSAAAGCALLGDSKYAGARRIVRPSGSVLTLKRVALHAACLMLLDQAGSPWVIASPLPSELRDLWRACGGQGSDLEPWDGEGHWAREWLAP